MVINSKYPSDTIQAITEFLFIGMHDIASINKEYDLIIVLGCNMIEGTIKKIDLIKKRGFLCRNAKIVLSGKGGSLSNSNISESERLYKCAVEYGFEKNSLITEPKATNTLENFKYSKEQLENYGGIDSFKSILVVGQAFVLRRASMCAAACEYPMGKIEYFGTVDVENRNISPDSWWTNDIAKTRVLEEIGRISTYTIKGDLSIY